LARTSGLRCGRIMIPVPRRSRSVCAAIWLRATAGSSIGVSGSTGEGGTRGSGSTTCSPVQTDSSPGCLRALRDGDHRIRVATNSEVDSKEADFHSELPEELGCPDQLDAAVALDCFKIIPVIRDNGSIPPSRACCDQGIKSHSL